MNRPSKLMTPEEFLAWEPPRPARWELVGGVPIEAMTGATHRHDRIVVNLIVELSRWLKDGPCRPTTDDIAVRTVGGANVRRPDVTVECGSPAPTSREADEPTAVFEVLSPSTRAFDQVRKPEEYKGVPSMRHVIVIDDMQPRAAVWTRAEAGDWRVDDAVGLDAAIHLSALGIELALAAVYENVAFDDDAA